MASKELENAKYINLHVHSLDKNGSTEGIFCVFSPIRPTLGEIGPGYFCAGIHPWYLDNFASQLKTVKELAKLDVCLMIGECGLDFVTPEGSEGKKQQIEVFQEQIHLSESLKKPLILHCVRAFDEILKIHKQTNPQMPWILHDFNANETQITQALKRNFYFSLGPTFLSKTTSKIHQLSHLLPLDKIFFETDELPGQEIETIYAFYAQKNYIELKKLKQQIKDNFKTLFSL